MTEPRAHCIKLRLSTENIISTVSKYEGLQQQTEAEHLTESQLPCTQYRSAPIGHQMGVYLCLCVPLSMGGRERINNSSIDSEWPPAAKRLASASTNNLLL